MQNLIINFLTGFTVALRQQNLKEKYELLPCVFAFAD